MGTLKSELERLGLKKEEKSRELFLEQEVGHQREFEIGQMTKVIRGMPIQKVKMKLKRRREGMVTKHYKVSTNSNAFRLIKLLVETDEFIPRSELEKRFYDKFASTIKKVTIGAYLSQFRVLTEFLTVVNQDGKNCYRIVKGKPPEILYAEFCEKYIAKRKAAKQTRKGTKDYIPRRSPLKREECQIHEEIKPPSELNIKGFSEAKGVLENILDKFPGANIRVVTKFPNAKVRVIIEIEELE